MASQNSLNAEHHLRLITAASSADQKLELIVKAIQELVRAVQALETSKH
jgi:hypothetical protein